MKKKVSQGLTLAILILLAILVLFPFWLMITQSFMGHTEAAQKLGPLFSQSDKPVHFTLIPNYPTLKSYVELLLDTPKFFVMFWNTARCTILILIGQIIIAVPAAYAFAMFEFRGKRLLFFIYMVVMILPFQVTMVSNYLVLNQTKLIDTDWAIILPGIFSTFPVFILTRFFESLPKEMIEAAKVDGAGRLKIMLHIALPICMGGIASVLILSFIEYWSAIEQPLTFLHNKQLWPMSLYLSEITLDNVSVMSIASLIAMAFPLLISLWGQTYLEQGIIASGIKQ